MQIMFRDKEDANLARKGQAGEKGRKNRVGVEQDRKEAEEQKQEKKSEFRREYPGVSTRKETRVRR